MVNFIMEIKKYIFDIECSSNDMRTKSDSILNISKTIKKISDSSKLLSLNAQIEAAKISDKNNGFGVISNEMVRMADDTRKNSILIDTTIDVIIKDIENLNKNIYLNGHKIEESIALCEIIVEFVEALTNEYKLNIDMFDSILSSMNEIIFFIEKIKQSINDGYIIADDVFRNTSTEYIAIDGFIEESFVCKEDANIEKNKALSSNKSSDNETLRVLMNFGRDFTYDPIDILYETEQLICRNLYNTLFDESKSGAPIPVLAKGWTDEEAKVWTIYLKNNIYFSNGDVLTAQDVEFSLLRTCVEGKSNSPFNLDIIESHKVFKSESQAVKEKISGIEVLSNNTIKIKLKRPDILFLSRLASNTLFVVSKKEYFESNNVIGTGTYYIDTISSEDECDKILCLKSNRYNVNDSPYIKNIQITISKKFEDYLTNADNCNFDILYPLPFSKINSFLDTEKDFIAESSNSYNILLINFIADSKNILIKNKDFRQSVFSIINNMDLNIDGVSNYFLKYNALSTHWYDYGIKAPNWIDNSPTLKTLKGKINIVTYDSWLTKLIANRIKSVLEKNGLNVNIHIDNSDEGLEKYDLSIGILSFDSRNLYLQLYDSISPPFGSYLLDKPIGKKLEHLTTISNYKNKMEMLKEIEIEILKEYYNLPMFFTKVFLLKGKNILNLSDESITSLKFENILKTRE